MLLPMWFLVWAILHSNDCNQMIRLRLLRPRDSAFDGIDYDSCGKDHFKCLPCFLAWISWLFVLAYPAREFFRDPNLAKKWQELEDLDRRKNCVGKCWEIAMRAFMEFASYKISAAKNPVYQENFALLAICFLFAWGLQAPGWSDGIHQLELIWFFIAGFAFFVG